MKNVTVSIHPIIFLFNGLLNIAIENMQNINSNFVLTKNVKHVFYLLALSVCKQNKISDSGR